MCQINMMDGQGYWFQSLHSYESPQIPQPTRIPKSSYYFYCCCCFKHLPKFKIAFIATISTKTTISPKEARPRTTNWTQMVLDFWCLSALSFRSVANWGQTKDNDDISGLQQFKNVGKGNQAMRITLLELSMVSMLNLLRLSIGPTPVISVV